MGVVKNLMVKAGEKAADKITKLSALSPEQVKEIQAKRDAYLDEMPALDDETAQAMTEKLLAASSVEIYNAYLPQIKELYLPIMQEVTNNRINNIRYLNITKWVTDKKENSIEKLVNVYNVLSDEECNIALVFNRTCDTTNVYLAVSNTIKQTNNVRVNDLIQRLENSLRGNFPGSVWAADVGKGTIPCFDNDYAYSVSSVSNIPAEKSEKFISQTIEKILDGVVPTSKSKEYTIVLLATPIQDIEERKLVLADFYSGLAPYASWQTNFTFVESDATSSMAIFGVNAGVSAGVQNAHNQAVTNTGTVTNSTNDTTTDSTNDTTTDTLGQTSTDSTSRTDTLSSSQSKGTNSSSTKNSSTTITNGANSSNTNGTTLNKSFLHTPEAVDKSGNSAHVKDFLPEVDKLVKSKSIGEVIDHLQPDASLNLGGSAGTSASQTVGESFSKAVTSGTSSTVGTSLTDTIGQSAASTVGRSIAESTSKSVANSVGRSLARSLGRAVSTALATTEGITKSVNLGGNFGANFARSSNITISVGKNEGITQSFTNYNIKHALELLENQMQRYEKSTALGMWDFAAYVISEDHNTASSVAHSYMALTQGEDSFLSKGAINTWRGDVANEKESAAEICSYVRDFNHPVFALNPEITSEDETINCYPPVVTATTGLSGKELAYSLNFPLHSVPGLPILKCAEFGRNVVSYDELDNESGNLLIGKIFHMNREEPVKVELSIDSLSSHMFITGSTGSGKSNTVYTVLSEAVKEGKHFLVIEPAKGEYKYVFGTEDVNVFGTNPKVAPLLSINPFSFPKQIHILEHLDRLIEIFNVCWPMYAAMPAVLKSAIEKSYEDCGWDLVKSENAYGDDLYPRFSDVTRNIRTIIDSSEYDTENKGAYKGALITRLQSLSNGINGLIFIDSEVDEHVLFDQNTIVDLSRVGSSETKSLIMGLLVLKLQEYRMSNQELMNAPLQHVTVLEEAHNLLKRTSTEQPVEGGNLMGKSVEMLANAIAEMRTYGEGFIIVDQAPGLLDLSAIRNTNTKIIMRLPDYTDRELVGRASNLEEDQIVDLAKLPCGVGAVYQNEWVQPVLCKINKHSTPPSAFNYESEQLISTDCALSYNDKLTIIELLCNGTTIGKEVLINDIVPILKNSNIDASVKVIIMKMLENPTQEPKMTKLAPIVNALFPEVKDVIVKSYSESADQTEWTKAANEMINSIYEGKISDQARRDIIQALMTYYLMIELNRIDVLEDWSKRGGLA